MKKKQWIISLILIGIIIISILLCKCLWKNDDKMSVNSDETILEEQEDDETEFVPTFNEEEDATNSITNETLSEVDNSDDAKDENKQDSGDADEDTGSVSTELPYVPFG